MSLCPFAPVFGFRLLSQDRHQLVDLLYDYVVGLLARPSPECGSCSRPRSGTCRPRTSEPGCLSLVLRVDVAPVRDAVKGAVVEVRHLADVSVEKVVELVLDSEHPLVLLEEGQDCFDGQPVHYVLLRVAQDLEYSLPQDQVPIFLRPQQGALVVVVDGIDPALVVVMVDLIRQGVPEGPLVACKLVRAALELNGNDVARGTLPSLLRIGGPRLA